MAFGLLHGVLTVPLGLSQHVVGLGITLLATAVASYAYRVALPRVTTPPRIEPFQPLPLPGVLAQTPLTYLAFATVARHRAACSRRTPLGLAIRAVGENPQAVEAQGLSVTALRIGAVDGRQRADGGGRRLPDALGLLVLLLRDGQRPRLDLHRARRLRRLAARKALLGALLFAAFDALQIRLQQTLGAAIPYQVFLMLPYALSILALVVMSRRARVPAALMIPYNRGER